MSGLSKNPLATVVGQSPSSGQVVGFSTVATTGFEKSLLTQGPTLLFESFDQYGEVVKGTTAEVNNHVTRPPSNISYSIDDNGFIL